MDCTEYVGRDRVRPHLKVDERHEGIMWRKPWDVLSLVKEMNFSLNIKREPVERLNSKG